MLLCSYSVTYVLKEQNYYYVFNLPDSESLQSKRKTHLPPGEWNVLGKWSKEVNLRILEDLEQLLPHSNF